MTMEQKIDACRNFFNKLSIILEDGYSMIGSCNFDSSVYLVPKGSEDAITYYGKPKKSFRLSDHWNWYTSLEKCSNKNYIQCQSADIPEPSRRKPLWKANEPISAAQVAFFAKDGKYHCVYGEKYDKKTKKWSWVEADPKEVAEKLAL